MVIFIANNYNNNNNKYALWFNLRKIVLYNRKVIHVKETESLKSSSFNNNIRHKAKILETRETRETDQVITSCYVVALFLLFSMCYICIFHQLYIPCSCC